MSSCSNKKFQEMIHAYELGILSKDDEKEFEIHLLECKSCADDVQNFQKESSYINNANEFREIALQKQKKKSNSFSFKYVVTAAAIIILLLLKPWSITFDRSGTVVATENKLVIFPFEDVTGNSDSTHTGEIIAHLLLTDLAESNYLKVNSSLQLYDLLKKQKNENFISSKELALDAAKENSAKWMITGTILQTTPNYIISAEIINVNSGKILTTEQVTGLNNQDIFSLVDRLTIEIKNDLDLPVESTSEPDYYISDITTTSIKAYQLYIEGLKYYNKYYLHDAERQFREAIEIDSTFAMAHYYRSKIVNDSSIYFALQNADKLSTREKQLISSSIAFKEKNYSKSIEILLGLLKENDADKEILQEIGTRYYTLKDYDNAIKYLNQTIQIDPYNKSAYNLLTYCYTNKDNFEKALLAINKYIEIAPYEANPYDTRAELYANFGKIDEAITSYHKSYTINNNFYSPMYNLSLLYMFKNDYINADSSLHKLLQIDKKQASYTIPKFKVIKSIKNGDFNNALSIIDSALVEVSTKTVNLKQQYSLYLLRAMINENLNNFKQSTKDLDKAFSAVKIKDENNIDNMSFYQVYLFLQNEQIEKTDSILVELKSSKDKSEQNSFSYWYSLGLTQAHKKVFSEAITSFEKAKTFLSSKSDIGYFNLQYSLARTYQQNEQLSEAINIYENLHTTFTNQRMFWTTWDIKSHFYLARAYEDSNWDKKAVEEYNIFLNYWGKSVEVIDILEDARNKVLNL